MLHSPKSEAFTIDEEQDRSLTPDTFEPLDDDLNTLGKSVRHSVWFVNNVKVKLVGTLISALMVLMFVVGGIGTVVLIPHVWEVQTAWDEQAETVEIRTTALSNLRGALGVGGLSDHLGQLALSGNAGLEADLVADIVEAREAIAVYLGGEASAAETQALGQISTLLTNYQDALPTLLAAASSGTLSSRSLFDHQVVDEALMTLGHELDLARKNGDKAFAKSTSMLITTIITTMSINGLLLVVLASFFFWFTRNRMVYPLYALREAMGKVSSGDRSANVPLQEKQDEMGDMARALQIFKENATKMDDMTKEQEQLRIQGEREKKELMTRTADDLEGKITSVVKNLSECSKRITMQAETMGDRMDTTTNRALGAATASDRTSQNVDELSAAAQHMAESMQVIGDRAERSTTIASQAVERAADTNVTVQGLAKAAERIGEVVAMITEIAEKTNLLALNATIESARAGEAGKGFAVVATEVKNLADQTGKATETIGIHIQEIQEVTNRAVGDIQGIGKTIGEIDDIISEIVGSVSDYRETTDRMATKVSQVREDAEAVAIDVADVNQTTAQAYGAAIRVLWEAKDLTMPTETLQKEIDGFLKTVRAG